MMRNRSLAAPKPSVADNKARVDGKEIKHFYQTPGKESIISDKIKSVQIAGNKLLLCSEKGAQWMDATKNNFILLRISNQSPASIYQNQIMETIRIVIVMKKIHIMMNVIFYRIF